MAFGTNFSQHVLKYRLFFPWNLKFKKMEGIQRTLLRTLKFSPLILGKTANYAQEHFGRVTIGVHMRYTDNLRFCEQESFESYLNAYFTTLDKLVERMPEAVIFLCTDNEKIIHLFEEKYGEIKVTQKWYPEGQTLGMNNTGLHHAGRRNIEQHRVEAAVDLCLLSKCDHLIHSSSTFGELAKLLANPKRTQFYKVKHPDIQVNRYRL